MPSFTWNRENTMNCQPIAQRLADLREQASEIGQLLETMPNGPGRQVVQENLANIQAQISEEQQALAECQTINDQGSVPRAFVARVKNILCTAASREVGKEEPYVLIGTVDMLATVGTPPLQ